MVNQHTIVSDILSLLNWCVGSIGISSWFPHNLRLRDFDNLESSCDDPVCWDTYQLRGQATSATKSLDVPLRDLRSTQTDRGVESGGLPARILKAGTLCRLSPAG